MIGPSSSTGGVFAALVEAVSLCIRGRVRIVSQCSEAGSTKRRILHCSAVKQNSNGSYFKSALLIITICIRICGFFFISSTLPPVLAKVFVVDAIYLGRAGIVILRVPLQAVLGV